MSHVVVAANPLEGHVLPMLLIGRHLRAIGHEVTFITGAQHRQAAADADLRFVALDTAGNAQDPPPKPALHRLLPSLLRRFVIGLGEMRSTFIDPLVAQHRALTQVLGQQAVDAVVVDLAFTGAMPLLLTEDRRPPVIICGVGPLTLSSKDIPSFGVAWQPRPGMDYDGMNRVVHGVMLGGIHSALNRTLRELGAPDLPVALTDWPILADRVVQLTVPDFEYHRSDLSANVSFVGPVLPADSRAFEPPDWWDAVLGAKTVVHVTQGTLDNHDLDQLIGPTMRALADQDVVVVATTGRRDEQTLRADKPPNAFVAEWIPYSALMPEVDIMITNGGYGGVQHALSYGVPVIVAGETADKAEVAARVAYTGVGLDLGGATPRSASIASAVHELRTNRTYRDAAARLGCDIAAADPLGRIAILVADEISSRAVARP